ncbi:MAG: hypothetical protein AB1894_08825 [Chloroflexota bacterium]
MSYMVVLIVDDLDDCPSILDAWERLGVSGVTIFESTGLGRVRRSGLRDDLPIMPSLHDIMGTREVPHRTLLSVVESLEVVEKLVAAAQEIIGDLNNPHTGFLFVVPVLQAYGLGKEFIRRE